ncbi:MAG: hypothetical protein ACJ71J_08735 [Nitrososphaeraceae archaeon]
MNSRIQFTLLASVVALVLSITPPTTTIRVQSAFATATQPSNITTTQPANITTNNLHYLNNRTFKT